MSSPVIRVESLSKLYRLGEVGTGSLAHDINRWWHLVRGKEDPYTLVGQVNDRTRKADKRKTEKLTAGATAPHEGEATLQSPRKRDKSKTESREAANSISASQHVSVSDFDSATAECVWALKDINFSVHQGEVLSIIGRNGAQDCKSAPAHAGGCCADSLLTSPALVTILAKPYDTVRNSTDFWHSRNSASR